MIVMLADQEPHLFTGCFDRGGEFAVLPLEFGGLAGAVSYDHWRLQTVEMPNRAQCGDRRTVKPHIATACRQPHWRQIVHAADAHAALDDVGRQAELALPVGRQCDRGEVSSRGLAT